jgi:hypothetical protein
LENIFFEEMYKDEIKTQLQLLKAMGKSRRQIEKDLGYSEFYIDQQLSKGGNEKLLQALSDYKDELERNDHDPHKFNAMEVIASQQRTIEQLTGMLADANTKNGVLEQKKIRPYGEPDELMSMVTEMQTSLSELSQRLPSPPAPGTKVDPRTTQKLGGKGQKSDRR